MHRPGRRGAPRHRGTRCRAGGPPLREVPAMSAGTLTGLFFDAVERYASHPAAFRYKAEGGTWQSVTHREVEERVRAISVGLRELGISPGDRVAILSETRLEWALADYARLF